MLRPEDIELPDLPRARVRGYDRRSTDDLLRRIAEDVRALVDERDLLQKEVRRLEEAFKENERVQEVTRRECDLILKKARTQADKIRNVAEKETVDRVEALKRVEKVHRLVRVELRTLLKAVLEELDTPSEVVREALKNRQLVEDLHHITSAAVEAREVAAPVSSPGSGVGVAESAAAALDAPETSQLAERLATWTSHTHAG